MNPYHQKKIIYLIESPLRERDFERYGIQNWIDNGWKVNVFDVTKIISPEFWSHVDGKKISFNFKGLKFFDNIDELLFEINNLQKKIVFIDLLNFTNEGNKIRKAAHTYGLIIRVRLGSFPEEKRKKNFLKLVKLATKPIIVVNKLIYFVKKKIQKIHAKNFNPDYLVVGGTKSLLNINEKKTSIIRAHNYDYDYFIEKMQVKSNANSNYLVFLDEDAAYHSDYKKLSVSPFVKANNYYPVIDNGLDKIAKSLNLNVRIAAHPKSNYENKSIKYKFAAIKDNTFELIRDAHIVIGHCSTVLQYAILLKKPIIIATTDEIEQASYAKYWKHWIDSFALILGKKVINFNNLSNLNNFEDYLKVDHKKYDLYIEKFVKTKNSPKKKLWNIVIERIDRDIFL